MQNVPTGAAGEAVPAPEPNEHPVLSAFITTADLIDAAYDLLVSSLRYEEGRTVARMSGETANQICSILRAGRWFAKAHLGDFVR